MGSGRVSWRETVRHQRSSMAWTRRGQHSDQGKDQEPKGKGVRGEQGACLASLLVSPFCLSGLFPTKHVLLVQQQLSNRRFNSYSPFSVHEIQMDR